MTSSPQKSGNRLLKAVPFAGAVLLLAVGSALIGPKIARASRQSNDALLCESLRYLRTEILAYAEEHQNQSPGYAALDEPTSSGGEQFASTFDDVSIPSPAADADLFIQQLTQFTDVAGHVRNERTRTCDHGPYMIAIPRNPITSKSAVLVVDQVATPGPDESKPYGWIYNAQTKRVIANVAGADSSGVPYANY